MIRSLLSCILLLRVANADRVGYKTRGLATAKADGSKSKGMSTSTTTDKSKKQNATSTTTAAGKGSTSSSSSTLLYGSPSIVSGSNYDKSNDQSNDRSNDPSNDVEMATITPPCLYSYYMFLLSEGNTTTTVFGETVESPVYEKNTGKNVAYYQHAALLHDNGECDVYGMIAFDLDREDNTYKSHLYLQGSCAASTQAITGGTGRFECAIGTLTYDYPAVSKYGYVEAKICGAGCTCK
jgi:hypothetical protein